MYFVINWFSGSKLFFKKKYVLTGRFKRYETIGEFLIYTNINEYIKDSLLGVIVVLKGRVGEGRKRANYNRQML